MKWYYKEVRLCLGDTALLEEVCHCGRGFEVCYAQDTTLCVSQLPATCMMLDS